MTEPACASNEICHAASPAAARPYSSTLGKPAGVVSRATEGAASCRLLGVPSPSEGLVTPAKFTFQGANEHPGAYTTTSTPLSRPLMNPKTTFSSPRPLGRHLPGTPEGIFINRYLPLPGGFSVLPDVCQFTSDGETSDALSTTQKGEASCTKAREQMVLQAGHHHDHETRTSEILTNPSIMESSISLPGKVLTDDLMRDLTGCEDLPLVLSADIRIDAEQMLGVSQLSSKLPSITSLNLNRSHIPQLRLLGTRYLSLKRLWLNNCHVAELRGIGACAPHLEEIYLAFNLLKDVTPVMDLFESLQVLDLEGNELSDRRALEVVLPAMHLVTRINLQGNPIASNLGMATASAESRDHSDRGPTSSSLSVNTAKDESLRCIYLFRQWVESLMPQLLYLDDIPTTAGKVRIGGDGIQNDSCMPAFSNHKGSPVGDINAFGDGEVFQRKLQTFYVDAMDAALAEELRMVHQCIRENEYGGLEMALEDQNRGIYSRPSTSRPGARPRLHRVSTAHPRSGCHRSSSMLLTSGGSSSLTTGSVVSGSGIRALLKRTTSPPPSGLSLIPSSTATAPRSSPQTAACLLPDEQNMDHYLFGDDINNEGDEWEEYKAQLLRRAAASAHDAESHSPQANRCKYAQLLTIESAEVDHGDSPGQRSCELGDSLDTGLSQCTFTSPTGGDFTDLYRRFGSHSDEKCPISSTLNVIPITEHSGSIGDRPVSSHVGGVLTGRCNGVENEDFSKFLKKEVGRTRTNIVRVTRSLLSESPASHFMDLPGQFEVLDINSMPVEEL